MQLCLAKGANVYVTSGNKDKIQKAISLGAKGGASYKDSRLFISVTQVVIFVAALDSSDSDSCVLALENWPAQIESLLNKVKKGTMLDAIIDSAGGDIMGQAGKMLKQGGRVVCYGMYVLLLSES